ncbi:hypothetical protein DPEC_G00052360 [Dallia pectoralis]|uniref:Uncharacterized protein n=1 Tax=Dallia pectoralis TaxID=75939 RepID=A0ACC2HBR5_DALPE|nr:hypothetical protein DPEC_G00052360 [Dallia pectoralis]
MAHPKGVNLKSCTNGFLNGGASSFLPSPSPGHRLMVGSLILNEPETRMDSVVNGQRWSSVQIPKRCVFVSVSRKFRNTCYY